MWCFPMYLGVCGFDLTTFARCFCGFGQGTLKRDSCYLFALHPVLYFLAYVRYKGKEKVGKKRNSIACSKSTWQRICHEQ